MTLDTPASMIDVQSDVFLDTPVACLAHLRAQGPTCPSSEGWIVVTSHELARQVLTDPATFSSRIDKHSNPPADVAEEVHRIRSEGWPYTSALGRSDAPEHMKHRQMVNKAFTPRALLALEPLVRQVAEELARSLPIGEEFDFQEQFAEPLPVWAISKVLGLPMERRNDIRRWSTAAVSTIGSSPSSEDWLRYEHDLLDFQHAMADVLASNRTDPQPGVIAELAQAIADEENGESDGAQMSLLLTLLRELVVAGNETTGKFIAESVRIFGADESVWARIRQEPSFAEGVVEECLRLASPTQSAMRIVKTRTELDGRVLEPGQLVMVSLASANRDDNVFASNDRFEPDRSELRSHLGFGQGPHMCIGAGLARMETRIAWQVLSERVASITPVGENGRYTRSYVIRGPLEMRAVIHPLS